jgi:hypothetical protein
LAWYDPSWLYRQKITIGHTLVAEDLTDFPVLITNTVVQAKACSPMLDPTGPTSS